MTELKNKLSETQLRSILERFNQQQRSAGAAEYSAENVAASGRTDRDAAVLSDPALSSFADLPAYKQLQLQLKAAESTGIKRPYFMLHEGAAKDVTSVGGRTLLNFSTYDYLGLNADPRVNAAAAAAAERYGTSAGASRLVAGERPVHRELERALAEHYHTGDCVVMVSGYAANVTTIASLFGPQDVIFADKLCHNSIMTGAQDSGAVRITYAHNDPAALEELLKTNRARHQRALIVTEGVFSMDGNIAKLDALIELKHRYNAFLMVDEAHALGCIGEHGFGSIEYFGADAADVDIWMGTLSKSLCTCGGFIAGAHELIELLKYKASGFVYSVGISPVLAAASLKALELLHTESWRSRRLQDNCRFALGCARKLGLNTGLADGTAVLPVIIGSSLTAASLSNLLVDEGVCVLPIVYPVVPESSARLRFFFSERHSHEQIDKALRLTAKLLPEAKSREQGFIERAQQLKAQILQQEDGHGF